MNSSPPSSTAANAQPRDQGILVLNFGGPRTLAEVPEFLYEILRDPNTLQLPFPQALQNALARAIARRRSPEVARQYGEIGGGSPIVKATEAIVTALEAALKERGIHAPLWVAHRYLPGHAEAAAQAIAASGVRRLLALPMYPHFTYTTTGSSLEQVRDALLGLGWEGRLEALRSYPDAAGYMEAMRERLQACLTEDAPPRDDTVILCSAHGLPRDYVTRGDPYVDELKRTVAVLRKDFPLWRFELSFQSRVGPAEWLRPYTDEIIPELGAQGVKHVVFLPISFVNDHIETLYEVGVTYFELARAHGIEPHRVQAVEDHPGFIRTLADAAAAWHTEGQATPAVALLPPDQTWRRIGRYTTALWALAVCGVLALLLA